MERKFVYYIDKENDNKIIEKFLKEQGFTHHALVTIKRTDHGILRNGTWEYINQRLHLNDELVILLRENEQSEHVVPVELDLDIQYEDEDILVVNKPANMPIHPSINNYENTLANAIGYYYNKKGIPFVFRCVNRLDRDTTGLTIIAKHSLSAGILSQMVSKREIKRTYIAICSGKVESEGTIHAPIGRVCDSTILRQVDFENGEDAITHYKRLQYDKEKNLSLVKINLLTGRTHQIRVHMKYIGHPLIGDFLYNEDYTYMNRQALHSYSLDFLHPITKEKMDFTSELFPDMKSIFQSIEL